VCLVEYMPTRLPNDMQLQDTSSPMRPESELVTTLCRTPIHETDRRRALALLSQPLDWDRFFSFAQMAQVEPVAFSNLADLDSHLVPSDVRDKAATLGRDRRAIILSRTLAMNDLLAHFDRAQIPVMVIKGPALAVSAYGDPSMRSFADIDLLVKKEDIPRARDLLLDSGCSREYDMDIELRLIMGGHALEFAGHPTKVELHWSLVSRYLRVPFDTSDVWATSDTVTCAGHEIRVLAPHVEFLFLCAHGAKHEWIQLRWICDIAQLASRMTEIEKERVVELAQTLHMKKLLALASRLMIAVFGDVEGWPVISDSTGARMQAKIDSTLERIGVRESVAPYGMSWAMRLHPSLPAFLYWIGSRERWRDRIACGVTLALNPSGSKGEGVIANVTRPARIVARAVRRLGETS
jgi:hypothetical protein